MTQTLSLQARAALLRQRQARERAERIKRSTLVRAAGSTPLGDTVDAIMASTLAVEPGSDDVECAIPAFRCIAHDPTSARFDPLQSGVGRGYGARVTTLRPVALRGKMGGKQRARELARQRLIAYAETTHDPNARGGFTTATASDGPSRGTAPSPNAVQVECGYCGRLCPSDDLTGRPTCGCVNAERYRYGILTRDGETVTFDRATGAIVETAYGAVRTSGDWRDAPARGERRGVRYMTQTGDYI